MLRRLCLAIADFRSTTAGAAEASGSTRSWSDIAADGRGADDDDRGTPVEVAVALGANEVLHCCSTTVRSYGLSPIGDPNTHLRQLDHQHPLL